MANRLDHFWAAVVAKHYLDGIHEGYAPDQAADNAAKKGSQAEHEIGSRVGKSSPRDKAARMDLLWALVAADEWNRRLEKASEPDANAVIETANRAVTEVSNRGS